MGRVGVAMSDVSEDFRVRLFIPGRSRTKGSLDPYQTGRGSGTIKITQRDRELSRLWKLKMVKVLRETLGITTAKIGGKVVRTDAEPYAGAVEVHRFFRFEREVRTAAGHEGETWPSQDTPWPTVKFIGDVDKLTRNLLDALEQSGVIADDCLVTAGAETKRWCLPGEEPGVELLVRPAGAWAFLVESIMLHQDQDEAAAAQRAELEPGDLF